MKVCKDTSVAGTIQKKRAEAIIKLGTLWSEMKAENPDKQEKDARERYMSATAAAMEVTLEKMRKEESQQVNTEKN